MKLCPVCGALAPDESETCPICGAVLGKEIKVNIPVVEKTMKKTKKSEKPNEKYDELIEKIESLEKKIDDIESLVWQLIFGIASHFELWNDIKELYMDEGRKKEAQTIEKIKKEFT